MTDQSIAHAASVPTLISTYEERQKQLEEAKSQVAAKQKLVAKSVEDIQTALAASGTTGDPFRDQFIKLYGIEPALEKAYKELNDSLAGHKGEFVLLAWEHDRLERAGWFRPERYKEVTVYRMGVLQSDSLVPSKSGSQLVVPVERYAMGEVAGARGEFQMLDGNPFDPKYVYPDPPPFYRYMFDKVDRDEKRHLYSSFYRNVRLVVGDKAVFDWLNEKGAGHLMVRLDHVLRHVAHEAA